MAAPAVEGAAVVALRSVMLRVRKAAERSGNIADRVRVVAVSKTKPVSLIRQVYEAGHRRFGENYVQEILEKAPQVCLSVCLFHSVSLSLRVFWACACFVNEESNKEIPPLMVILDNMNYLLANEVGIPAGVPNMAMIEGVDNEKMANQLDRVVSSLGRNPLKVCVQVNTSGEASKSGIDPSGCVELVKHVRLHCPNLEFSGLMTIGMPDYSSTPENFKTLSNCRTEVCKALGMVEEQCELSMGMSGDFELAIEMGSTNVRVGSTIFGPREYPKKQSN
ncbi:hypothetical protein FH972_020306 [Carpinus fangiana]|uniref:Pyridoxal phosphate homeostasis protein n=1 Tax=Carpinus fangiana TaxID=176857 RepID=A0A5N6RUD7_9ROSI|nr:hypothetical protein FH972_020306 [Carpinus fangiana]